MSKRNLASAPAAAPPWADRVVSSRQAFARGRLAAWALGGRDDPSVGGWYAGECPCGWYYVGTYGSLERHADVCPRLARLPEEERIAIVQIRVLVCRPDESGGVL